MSAPKDENELQHLLYTAANSGRVMAVRYPRGNGAGVKMDKDFRMIPIGKGEILEEGDDIALLAVGISVQFALEAAAHLKKKGISVTVVNARFIKPLDSELILNVAGRIKKIITIEENNVKGGFGNSVIDLLHENDICDVSVRCIGVPDMFVEHGTQEIIRKKYGLDTAGIVDMTLQMMAREEEILPVTDGKL